MKTRFFANGVTSVNADTVIGVYDLADDTEVHIKITQEGLIIDHIDSQGEVIGTMGMMADEVTELCD